MIKNQIRAVIIDDEQPALERIRKLLKPYSDFDLIGEATDGLSALSLIEEKKPDVVFLDIDMPELSGLEVAKTLGVQGPLLVFVTAYDDYALQAFESSAIDYLVKPINNSRLDFTIDKIRKTLKHSSTSEPNRSLDSFLVKMQQLRNPIRLAIKIGVKYEVFDPQQIIGILAKDHYTALIINDIGQNDKRELLSDDSLELILTRLNPQIFIRVHRGAILNVHYIKELKREGDRKYTAIMNDKFNTQISISRERLPHLKNILGME